MSACAHSASINSSLSSRLQPPVLVAARRATGQESRRRADEETRACGAMHARTSSVFIEWQLVEREIFERAEWRPASGPESISSNHDLSLPPPPRAMAAHVDSPSHLETSRSQRVCLLFFLKLSLSFNLVVHLPWRSAHARAIAASASTGATTKSPWRNWRLALEGRGDTALSAGGAADGVGFGGAANWMGFCAKPMA